jgi:hypothetical protein
LSQSDGFLRYETLTAQAARVIEDIRKSLADGIVSGKVALSHAPKINDERIGSLPNHPTLEIIGTAGVDIVVIDDRYVNQTEQSADQTRRS